MEERQAGLTCEPLVLISGFGGQKPLQVKIVFYKSNANQVKEGSMSEKMELGCAILGALCLIYYMIIIAHAGIGADFAWFWAAGGICFLLYGLLIRHNILHPQVIVTWIVRIILVLLVVCFVAAGILVSQIVGAMTAKVPQDLEYVIVLGAQVHGTKPSRALRKRLDCAAEYAKENPDTIFFLSGGKGSGEEITEAEAMYRYLTEAGIDGNRLIREEHSTTTKENLEFCDQIREIREKKVGILSNNFHVYRAGLLAKKLGYQQTTGIPAPSDNVMQVHYVVREIFALALARFRGNI